MMYHTLQITRLTREYDHRLYIPLRVYIIYDTTVHVTARFIVYLTDLQNVEDDPSIAWSIPL